MFEFSEKSLRYQALLNAFMEQHSYPNEAAYTEQLHAAENRYSYLPLMDELKTKARAAGLWNLFIPPSLAEFSDHRGLSNFDYVEIKEGLQPGDLERDIIAVHVVHLSVVHTHPYIPYIRPGKRTVLHFFHHPF